MSFTIGNYQIGTGRVFIIAEIGNNHNGDFNRAIEMIDQAADFGADCVKFQMRNIKEVYRERAFKKSGEDLGTEYILDLLSRFELSVEQHKKLFVYSKKIGILYLCTPWDALSVIELESFGVEAYKVSSADLTNIPLLERLVDTGKPLILSTGMSVELEIKATVDYLGNMNSRFALLHCNSTYPAPFHDINLRWLESLKKIHPIVGYSGHERGINVSLGAVALGASIIERHFSLDREMEGPDHAASLTGEEFRQLVLGVREIEQALGDGGIRKMSQGELINRENLGKSLVAAVAIKRGEVLGPHHIKVRSPGQGLSPQRIKDLIGITSSREILEEDFFYPSDIDGMRITPGAYSFNRAWGIPVRYHDFQQFNSVIQPDLWEFHLSFSDMSLNIDEYFEREYPASFVVHAPELFDASHLLDLASPDEAYRAQSILELQKVIQITRKIKQFFPRAIRPMIVGNVGGFSMDRPIPRVLIGDYYERFALSLSQLDLDGVELIPQTMAPFPWHFGGQRHQNIFVEAHEIVEWCKRLKLRMCFDVSHSMLACNNLKIDFYEFSSKVAPFTAHIHLGDARDLNGEGLQIGEGSIDFRRLSKILKIGCPAASFIPEIWQGHKNSGEGFWIALNKLESLL